MTIRDGGPRPRSFAVPVPRPGPAGRRGHVRRLLTAVLVAVVAAPAGGQDSNLRLPPDSIERLLAGGYFELVQSRDTRFEGDRTQHALLDFTGTQMLVKWARAPRGGGTFNNEPRYELAAYRVQKLFLEPSEYVVPPTVVRCFPLGWVRQFDDDARETFDDTGSVLAVLQYWLWNVGSKDVFDEDRFEADTLYARHLANLNVFTYLVRHNDANLGNVLISEDPDNPRVFAVDNGVAFESEISNRGYDWRRMRVDRIPRATVDRLRRLTRADLDRELGVLVQFEQRGDQLVATEPGDNLDPGRGIRREEGVVQLGLTEREISRVWDRLEELLEEVDSGEVELF